MTAPTKNSVPTTAAQCLAAIAQRYGLALSPEQLTHEPVAGRSEPNIQAFLDMATTHGLDASYRLIDWRSLLSLEGVFPVVARLNNGNYVIVAGTHKDKSPERVAILDPLESDQNILSLDAIQFCARWTGDVVLLKKTVPSLEIPSMSQQEIELLTSEVNLLLAWKQTGYASPPPDFVKKEALLRNLSKLDPRETLFIETGTAAGTTARMVAARGYQVTTIELAEHLYQYSRALLEPMGVTCLHGNSVALLPKVIDAIPPEMSVFCWLDGHYSGDGTAKGDSDIPIVQELLAIERRIARSEKPLLVQVDDIRMFGVDEMYPELDHLVDYCRKNMLYWNMALDSFIFSNRKKLVRQDSA